MKKVLALVLAVIMVCTMAMAAGDNVNTNNQTPVVVISSGATATDPATIVLDPAKVTDFTKTYVLAVPSEYFDNVRGVLGLNSSPKKNKELFTVEGLKGAWDETETIYCVTIPVADKPLDKVADFTIGSFVIKANANNYVEFIAKDGKLVVNKVVVGGLVSEKAGVTAKTLDAAYDIGFTAATTFTGADGWYYTENNALKADVTGLLSLSVPAKTYFKFTNNADSATPTLKTKGNMQTSATIKGATVTAGTLTLTVPGNKDTIIYGMDKDGKLFANPTTLVVTADENGIETGAWTATGTSIMNVATFAKTEANVSGASTTPGTTTNPGTGANDVVGVAAALAVVALVSGAAISLKK